MRGDTRRVPLAKRQAPVEAGPRCRLRHALGVLLFVLCPLSAATLPGVAAEPEPDQPPPSGDASKAKPKQTNLDDALLKDLDNELLEGAGDLKGPRAPAKPAATGQRDPSKSSPDPAAEGADIGKPSEDADPLAHISGEMRQVEDLIPKTASRTHAEELQRRIVDDLSRLIAQAEAQRAAQQSGSQSKRQSSSSKRAGIKQPKPGAAGGSSKESKQPARDSTDRLGKAEPARPDAEAMKGLMKDSWGHLPPRAREQMLQNSPERFLPQYELLIEKYYQRLAEEQGVK